MEFRDPPPVKQRGGRPKGKSGYFNDEVVQALKDNPGRWAHIATAKSPGVAYYQKQERLRGIEFTIRTVDGKDRIYDLYARYNPPTEEKR